MEQAETAESSATTALLEGTTIVDADVPISYKSSELQRAVGDRMKEPYRSYLVAGTDDETEEGMNFNYAYPVDGRPRSMGGKKPLEVTTVADAGDVVRELCDGRHVDHPIVNTTGVLNRIQDTERVRQEMRAGNDVLLDRFLDEDDRIYGLGTVYAKNPTEAAEEIDRLAGEDRIVGVYVQSSGVEIPLGDPRYDSMYRAAEDNGMPIVFHGTADIAHARDLPVITYGFRTYFESKTVAHPWSQMITLTSIALEGVPVKFPDLEFVFLNAGVAWARWMMARINREYGQRPSEAPLLDDLPEKYIEESCYFGLHPIDTFEDPYHTAQMLDNVGADNIMFASNFPAADFDEPSTAVEHLDLAFTREEVEKVLYRNAADVFDLDV